MLSLAREYSTHSSRDLRSMGLSFQRRVGSAMRRWNRRSCSASETENQYLTRMIPERSSIRSNSGQARRNSWYSSSVQKPMTRSTPARLYQLRSNRTISPAAGRWATYRWKYHWVRSRSVGAARATTRQMRGLRLSVIRLIVPPLPAASRPSKITTTLSPACLIHSWSLISSSWRRASSSSYGFFFILVVDDSSASMASRGLADLSLAMGTSSRTWRYCRPAMGTRVVEDPPLGGDQRLVTIDDIRAARERVAGVIRPTPVDRSESLSALAGRPVILKPEHRQRTGSFKIRGAYNRISRLPPGTPVVAGSAGNHAQGVALAAKLTGHPATIFMPVNAPLPKVEATRNYGATVRVGGQAVDDCIASAKDVCRGGEA